MAYSLKLTVCSLKGIEDEHSYISHEYL